MLYTFDKILKRFNIVAISEKHPQRKGRIECMLQRCAIKPCRSIPAPYFMRTSIIFEGSMMKCVLSYFIFSQMYDEEGDVVMEKTCGFVPPEPFIYEGNIVSVVFKTNGDIIRFSSNFVEFKFKPVSIVFLMNG